MRAVLVVMGFVLAAAAPRPMAPDNWLQARMDRVGSAAGLAQGAVRAVIVNEGAITLDDREPTITVPRAVIINAPSAQAVDGILAMLLSYRQLGSPVRRGASAGEFAAFAALIAATGGISDDKDSKVIPLGYGDRPVTEASRGRGEALRGARWAEAAGVCTAELTDYLRVLARGPVADGSAISARRLLADMGMLAFPSSQPCPMANDQGFVAVHAQLAASG